MTTDIPESIPVDYLTWSRDFHGIRPKGAPDLRQAWPARLSGSIHAVACAVASSIYGKTGEAKLGLPRIAERAQVSESTVSKVLPMLESGGWLRITRTIKPGTNGNMPNLYELTSPVAALRAAAEQVGQTYPVERGGVPRGAEEGTPLNGDELRTELRDVTTKDEKHSVAASIDPVDESFEGGLSSAQARAWLDGEKTAEAHPIHPDWKPRPRHRNEATELGLDVDALAEQFHAGFTASDEKRDNWGGAFMAYLRATDAASEKVTFTGADIDAVEDVQAQQVAARYQAMRTQQDVFGSTSEQVPAEPAEDPWAEYLGPAPVEPAPVAVAEVVAEPIEDVATVAEVVASPAPVVALAPSPTRAASQTNRLKRDIRKPWRREDVVLAHELFEAGQRYDSVKDAVKAQMAARTARTKSELANHPAVPLPVSA